jgi:antitoxin ParD1/3/4
MNVRLRPEIEELIKRDVARGDYQSVDEYVERAVAMLHEQEAWLVENPSKIQAQIEEGYAAAERGELIEGEEVRSRMKERKSSRPAK